MRHVTHIDESHLQVTTGESRDSWALQVCCGALREKEKQEIKRKRERIHNGYTEHHYEFTGGSRDSWGHNDIYLCVYTYTYRWAMSHICTNRITCTCDHWWVTWLMRSYVAATHLYVWHDSKCAVCCLSDLVLWPHESRDSPGYIFMYAYVHITTHQ